MLSRLHARGSLPRHQENHQGQPFPNGGIQYVRGTFTLHDGYNIQQVNGLQPLNSGRGGYLVETPFGSPPAEYCITRVSPMDAVVHEAEPQPAQAQTTARVPINATPASDLALAREAQDIKLAIQNSLMEDNHPDMGVDHEYGHHGAAPANQTRPLPRHHQSQQGMHSFWERYVERRGAGARGSRARNPPAPQPDTQSRPGLPGISTNSPTAACTLCSDSRAVHQDPDIADGLPVCEKCCDEMIRAEQTRAERERRVRFFERF
ncbi:hypothetical protein FQN49_002093 [Arthroderma sp. PD_2]|nr:hypothetical protein FQN49_002093 [Arthroderma sp. PD_2]